jgi:hypothetical protein
MHGIIILATARKDLTLFPFSIIVLINNAEVTQIGNQEETNKTVMKNLKLLPADILLNVSF